MQAAVRMHARRSSYRLQRQAAIKVQGAVRRMQHRSRFLEVSTQEGIDTLWVRALVNEVIMWVTDFECHKIPICKPGKGTAKGYAPALAAEAGSHLHTEGASGPLCSKGALTAGRCSSNGAEVLARISAAACLPGHAGSCRKASGGCALLAVTQKVPQRQGGCDRCAGDQYLDDNIDSLKKPEWLETHSCYGPCYGLCCGLVSLDSAQAHSNMMVL